MAQPVTFHNVRISQEQKLFLNANPWKVSVNNIGTKYFRFCLACGKDQFQYWEKMEAFTHPIFCSIECDQRCADTYKFVPSNYIRLSNEEGKKIEDVVMGIEVLPAIIYVDAHDWVYPDGIPENAPAKVKEFEKMPLGTRLKEIKGYISTLQDSDEKSAFEQYRKVCLERFSQGVKGYFPRKIGD
jgi:hypothetical protein